MQILAAILRFADEISDDSKRAGRVLLKLKVIPKTSEVFHEYASHLHSVLVDLKAHAVELHFEIDKKSAVRKFGKLQTTVYLLNEIYERTLKTHAERVYCKRFMHEIVRLDSVTVTIKVFAKKAHLGPTEEIKYRLEERGYPDVKPRNIKALCPDLRWSTGEQLRKYLLSGRNVRKRS